MLVDRRQIANFEARFRYKIEPPSRALEFDAKMSARGGCPNKKYLLFENVLSFVAAKHHFLHDSVITRDFVDGLRLWRLLRQRDESAFHFELIVAALALEHHYVVFALHGVAHHILACWQVNGCDPDRSIEFHPVHFLDSQIVVGSHCHHAAHAYQKSQKAQSSHKASNVGFRDPGERSGEV